MNIIFHNKLIDVFRLLQIPIFLFGVCQGDVSHLLNEEYDAPSTSTTPAPPPHPYFFSYSAGRYPGHIDRTHSEVSDGSGTVRGSYAYVDPRNQVRTVDYTADEYGFHPQLSHEPKDTRAVARAKERHFILYNRIAERNLQAANVNNVEITVPRDSDAVAFAKQKHFTLYDKIAMEHAHIAAEREAERRAYQATSSPNDVYENDEYIQ